MACPDDATLGQLVNGALPRDQAFRVRDHVIGCDACTSTVERLETQPAPQERIGRYLLLEEVGRGGMGRVFRGFDPQLERFVALKLLLDSANAREEARQRLQREAQAMARLVHPHIVQVFDAGTRPDGAVYLVMEYVRGPTLREWQQEKVRPWLEVLATWLGAGEGLAAAHAAGLVHRDFKPGNVLVADGVAKVTDFGLARLTGTPGGAEDVPVELSPVGAATQITRGGATPGTPKYMAPEQWQGQFDARSDQFSFARALEEALRKAQAPAWTLAALARAQAQDPAARYPSMAELLEALSVSRRRARSLQRGLAAATVTLALVSAGAWRATRVDCEAAATPVRASWTAHRSPVLARFEALPGSTRDRLTASLDGFVARWAGVSRSSCEARLAGHETERVHAARDACLARRLEYFTTVTTEFEEGRANVELAPAAIDQLPPPAECGDDTVLASGLADEPPEVRERAQPLRVTLSRVDALAVLGELPAALPLVDDVLARARALKAPGMLAEATLYQGQLHRDDFKVSRPFFEEAFQFANASRRDELAARAAIELVYASQAEPRVSQALLPVAQAAVDRAGRTDVWEATLAFFRGRTAISQGDGPAAVEQFRHAVELRKRVSGPTNADTLDAQAELANAMLVTGEFDAAIALARATAEKRRDLAGVTSLAWANEVKFLASVEIAAGHYPEAERDLDQAKALFAARGIDPLGLPDLFDSLTALDEVTGHFDAAVAKRRRLLELADNDGARGRALGLLSRALLETGATAEASTKAKESVKVLEGINPRHQDLIVPLTTIGRLEHAAAPLERALALDCSDPEFRGDALLALSKLTPAARAATVHAEAMESYRKGNITFRLTQP
jgi:tetratricopeptide (TPR) repeat protein